EGERSGSAAQDRRNPGSDLRSAVGLEAFALDLRGRSMDVGSPRALRSQASSPGRHPGGKSRNRAGHTPARRETSTQQQLRAPIDCGLVGAKAREFAVNAILCDALSVVRGAQLQRPANVNSCEKKSRARDPEPGTVSRRNATRNKIRLRRPARGTPAVTPA